MSMHLEKISEEEYQRRKIFFVEYVRNVLARESPGALSAISALEEFEKKSKSAAKKSLEIGIRECLLDAETYSREAIEGVDKLLREKGGATISELLTLRSKKFKKILQSGVIKDCEEYRYIKELIDSDSVLTSQDVRAKLIGMLNEFESNAV